MTSGTTYDDPSEDLLFMLFEDVLGGAEDFFIVERLADPTGQTYVQTAQTASGWRVEKRAGSPKTHVVTEVAEHRAAHALVTHWCFGTSTVPLPTVEWRPLES